MRIQFRVLLYQLEGRNFELYRLIASFIALGGDFNDSFSPELSFFDS